MSELDVRVRAEERAFRVVDRVSIGRVDKDQSLLFSLEISDVDYDFARLNLYPNALYKTDPGIGFFASATRDRHFMAGLSFTRTLGVGAAVGKQ